MTALPGAIIFVNLDEEGVTCPQQACGAGWVHTPLNLNQNKNVLKHVVMYVLV